MAQRQAAQPQRLVHHINTPVRRRITSTVIVIAAHKGDLQSGVRLAPPGNSGHRGCRVRALRVQKIAQEDDALDCVTRHQLTQQVQTLGGCTRRYRHPQGAKAHRFADVRISDKQGEVFGKEGRFLGQQMQAVAADVNDAV